jgi:nicotinate-nucleotide pyrophosphorylase (carboxylating)
VKPPYITPQILKQFIASALSEDIGDGDHSTLASIPKNATSRAKLLVKEDGVVAGIELAMEIFKQVDPTLKIDKALEDGARVTKGDIAFTIEGSARSILTSERL